MSQANGIVDFDPTTFRSMFPAFADPTKFPDALLTMYWNETIAFIENTVSGDFGFNGRQLALYLLEAHFLALMANVNKGKQGGFITSSTIDKVSVTRLAPPSNDHWSWWLDQSPYGQQLMALLEVNSVGGWSVGGLPERSGFRKVFGTFI